MDQTTSSATLTAKIGNTNVEMTKELNSYEERGYWIDNTSLSAVGLTQHKSGLITLSGSGEHIVYLFVPENVSVANRSVSLSLSASGANTKEASISQFCPTSTGCERIEEDPYQPWGPYWEFEGGRGKTVTYTIDKNSEGYDYLHAYMYLMYESPFLGELLKGILGIDEVAGVDPNFGSGILWWKDLESVSIDYSSYLEYTTSDDGGLVNTKNIFNGTGSNQSVSQLLEIEEMVSNASSGVTNEPIKKDFENSAIIGAVKKNRFELQEAESTGGSTILLICPNSAIKWHLPSISEIPTVLQYKGEPGETLIDGTYWSSSTSTGDLAISHSKVYTWPSGPPSEDKKRDEATYKFRAVRVSGSDTQFQNQ